MDLSDLRIFRAVVREGGVTRAAERLHRVQSNVTTRVRQLEQELGVQLFLRQGKRLHVAPAGQILLGYADRLLDLAQEAFDAVQEPQPRGLFRLGAMESTAAVRLPGPLSELHRRYPEVTLELRTGNPQLLASAVLAGELDAAFVAEPIADAPFEKVCVYDEELVVVAAAHHPPIDARKGTPRTMIAFESGCPHRRRLEEWFARRGAAPERTIELSSYHAMLGCVMVGMGVSLLPRSVLSTFPGRQQLTVYALPPKHAHAQTVLLWRKGARSPKILALLEVLGLSQHGPAPDRNRRARH
jgi:DNA-binding transcriptional LysR family regulator